MSGFGDAGVKELKLEKDGTFFKRCLFLIER